MRDVSFSVIAGDNDIVSLSHGLELKNGYLVDGANGARHFVKPIARPALCLLRNPSKFMYWLQRTDWLTINQQYELVKFMDDIGCLRVKRSLIGRLMIWARRLIYRLYGMEARPNARRFKTGFVGICKAVGNGVMPLLVLLAVAMFGAYGANFPVAKLILVHAFMLVTVYVSTVVHESVHWILASPYSNASQMLVRGLRIGLLHKPLPKSIELKSAIYGPLSGLLAAVLMALLVNVSFDSAVYSAPAAAVGIVHLMSWLPSYGDGQTLRRIGKQNA